MVLRPAVIARRLKISTSTLRKYEDLGMLPRVLRSTNGYRIYTEEHMAYFSCIREMLHGFNLSQIAKILRLIMEKQIDEALWTVNRAQAELQKDKYTCGQIRQRFLLKKRPAELKEYTIDEISKATGIIPSTIRYWDNIGLISASRCAANNYRTFTQKHMDEILMIHALKLSLLAQGEKYAVEHIHKEINRFNFDDTDRISSIVAGIESYLTALNKAQIRSISALYKLCTQVEQNRYE